MIFSFVNANGEHACDLALCGKKDVTRRKNPIRVGAIRAIQRGRGKFGEGFFIVESCVPHIEWEKSASVDDLVTDSVREGFTTYQELLETVNKIYGGFEGLYRIEMRALNDD